MHKNEHLRGRDTLFVDLSIYTKQVRRCGCCDTCAGGCKECIGLLDNLKSI